MNNLNPLEATKYISEYSSMAIMATFLLICTGAMMFFLIHWFIEQNDKNAVWIQKVIEDISNRQKEQASMVQNIREGVNDESLNKIKIISEYAFDLAKDEIFRALEHMKSVTNLSDQEAVEKETALIVENLHNNRNGKFDAFSYSGRRLSEYTDHAWVERLTHVVMDELYDEGYDPSIAITNINLAYEEIKVEFYENLKKVKV